MRTPEYRQQGYSLIEVLVAFVILAMALTVLLRIFSVGLRNVDAAAEYVQAVAIADAEIAAPGVVTGLQPGLSEGVVDDRFHWMRSVTAAGPDLLLAGDKPALPIYRIAVTVEWPARQGLRRLEFETLRLDRSAGNAP